VQRSAYQWKHTASGRRYYLYDDEDLVCELNAAGHALAGVIFVANNTPYGYKGQWGYYTDGETGLLLLTHRYCDPATGRFLTRDPIRFEGASTCMRMWGMG
jgi:RHS repeat-associated protein